MPYSPDDLRLALDLAAGHVKSVAYTSPRVRTVAVLAAAATHVPRAVQYVPRIFVTGPYGSGKSTLLSAIQPLVDNPVRNAGQLSTTFAYRNDFRDASVDGVVPTSIVDETKHIFKENGKGGTNHPLYAIATEGYSISGAPIKFQEKEQNATYSCYQVAFFASRGMCALPEDVLQRSIRLELAIKPEGMKLQRVNDPTVIRNGEDVGKFLHTSVQAAFKELRVIARDTDWYEKAGLDNRTADVWVVLFAIAELAGGHWPSLISAAYAELGAKTSRNLPTAYQLKVDALAFIRNDDTADYRRIPARELISYLMELGRRSYTWDDAPFSVKRFGMELKAAGLTAFKSNGQVYYKADGEWLKEADRLANPVMSESADPENTWDALDELV